ncbi:MAG TPA: AAA family ATPase, partial [Spirochaetota bacterium]|nr:AAA family ATPase [Spirochaetota bacterium]
MYLKRDIDITFTEWKNSEKRKPLLLRGARQVGKTDSVRNLAKSFDNYIEINFESDSKLAAVFDKDLKADRICRELAAIFLIPIIEGKTLLFFDEIQSCTRAIQALRYFYEQKPGLHVIAAGSLIEFALQKIPTFGVGRIRSVFMYPLSFNEFLSAWGKDMILDFKRNGSPANPISAPVHDQLLEYQKMFMLTGGMPEVAAAYIENGDIIECRRVIDDLIYSYVADFAKYEDNFPADIL